MHDSLLLLLKEQKSLLFNVRWRYDEPGKAQISHWEKLQIRPSKEVKAVLHDSAEIAYSPDGRG